MARITFYLDNAPLPAEEGEVLAAALWREGHRQLWCGVGHCFACVVTVDGTAGVRSCLLPVRPGMRVTLEEVLSHAD